MLFVTLSIKSEEKMETKRLPGKRTYQNECEEANDNPASTGGVGGVGQPITNSQKYFLCVCSCVVAVLLVLYFANFFGLGK